MARKNNNDDKKLQDLSVNREDGTGQFLTTNQGLRINDNQNSLKAGDRGATLLEDFIMREKITHFDHERIPERIVHARGSGAHGFFKSSLERSPALSMENTVKNTIKSRKVAALIADGFDAKEIVAMKKALAGEGAQLKFVATKLGAIKSSSSVEVSADFSFLTTSSVCFDAVYVPGGAASIRTLSGEPDAVHFVNEAYKHCKAICFTGDAVRFLENTYANKAGGDKAIIFGKLPVDVTSNFIRAIIDQHRNWGRETARKVPG